MQRLASRSGVLKRFVGSGKELKFGVDVLNLCICLKFRLVTLC